MTLVLDRAFTSMGSLSKSQVFSNETLMEGLATTGQQEVKAELPSDTAAMQNELEDILPSKTFGDIPKKSILTKLDFSRNFSGPWLCYVPWVEWKGSSI